jgi:rubredoxin---NAD+ reductase
MTSTQDPLIIIGTGLAGYNVAKEVRKLNKTVPMIIISEQDGAFYSKPQLSTALTRKKTASELVVFDKDHMSNQLQAEILTETVTKIEPEKQCLHLASKKTLNYSDLVLATGARVIEAPIAGDGAGDVFAINHLQHYAHFRQSLEQARRIVIIGSGLVGCEYSNDLINGGYDVSIVSLDQWPLERFLPEQLGRAMADAFSAHGIELYLGQSVTAMNHQAGAGYELMLSQGEQTLQADLVLSAVGFRPEITLAKQAGLTTDLGICVNRQFQTSDAHIYALGDCAVVAGYWQPYVAPILHGAKVLAAVLVGKPQDIIFPPMPIITKTPFCPCTVMPAIDDTPGRWQIEGAGIDYSAQFLDQHGQMLGFALTGSATQKRRDFVQALSV